MNQQLLRNKTVIITAGNQGGGAVHAMRFAVAGANIVIIADKTKAWNTKVSDKIISSGGNAITLAVDFSNIDDLKFALSIIVDSFPSIDILINNFSIFHWKSAAATSPEEFQKVMTNTFATFFLSQLCVPYLQKAENPHVINIAPPLNIDVFKEACANHLLFSIAKYGMSFCTVGMAEEFKQYGIAFNSLWHERPTSTATVKVNFGDEIVRGSYRPELCSEAAYIICIKSAKNFTGNYCIDEEIIRDAGIDVRQFTVDPSARPTKDIFLVGADYAILNQARNQ